MENKTLEDSNVILINKNYENIIKKISKDYDLEYNQLINKYKLFSSKDTVNIVKKNKRKRNKIPDHFRCLGRKQCGNQCTRRRRSKINFCGSHEKGLPYGRIDDGIDYKPKVKGKRGRKKKNPSLEDLSSNNDYIATWKDPELGDQYLIDKDNIVYTNNPENPRIVGRKNTQGKIESFDFSEIDK
jgi:hypothetical protein